MVITTAELTGWVGQFYWPFIRIGAMVISAPVFGAHYVPTRIGIGIALVLTTVVMPVVPEPPAVEPLSLAGLVITVQQVLIGVAIGFGLSMVFSAVVLGAHKIALSMGLGFAQMVDPANGVQVPVLGQFYLILSMLIFLGLDGHLALIELVADSFEVIPVGVEGFAREDFWRLVSWGTELFAGAVLMGLPVVMSKMMVLLAFGIVARASPQLNIFAIGFPVMMLVGFVLILITLPGLVAHVTDLLGDMFALLRAMFREG